MAPGEGAHTTHLTVADGMGNIVASTQTINSLFGARYIVPGTGMIPNNYMFVFTPHPGRVNSVAPGKRITSSMSPVMVLKDGKPRYALGLPGGLRIFPSVMQAISNLIDHGMSVQEAVEAPRLWTQGFGVEVENSVPSDVLAALRDRGHDVAATGNVGGGMSAIQFDADGTMTGAACWRARRHADRARRRLCAQGRAVQAGGAVASGDGVGLRILSRRESLFSLWAKRSCRSLSATLYESCVEVLASLLSFRPPELTVGSLCPCRLGSEGVAAGFDAEFHGVGHGVSRRRRLCASRGLRSRPARSAI